MKHEREREYNFGNVGVLLSISDPTVMMDMHAYPKHTVFISELHGSLDFLSRWFSLNDLEI